MVFECIPPGPFLNYGTIDVNENLGSYLWGGPFAITAPPPCMDPHALRVEVLQYDSAVVRWDVPVGVDFSRLEYGPAGFVPGTGTVVDSIVGGEWRIGGLEELSTYDVYVTGWCRYQECFSGTVDTSFSTPEACPTKFNVGEPVVTDSSIYLSWTVPAEAGSSEVLVVAHGADSSQAVTFGPLTPDSNGVCTLFIDGLLPGTTYEISIRNWCPHSQRYSEWHPVSAMTLRHCTVTAQPNYDRWGSVTGSGSYLQGTYVTLSAQPANSYCHFATWSDGVLYATRVHQVTQDTTFTAIFYCDTATAVPAVGDLPFTLAPNPTDGLLTISTGTDEALLAEVFDAAGRCVMRQQLRGPQSSLDVCRLPAGRYLLRLSGNERYGSRAFVKQ